jgi:hypothetical protein
MQQMSYSSAHASIALQAGSGCTTTTAYLCGSKAAQIHQEACQSQAQERPCQTLALFKHHFGFLSLEWAQEDEFEVVTTPKGQRFGELAIATKLQRKQESLK